MVCVLDYYLCGPTEVVIAGSPEEPEAADMLASVRRRWIPNRVVICHDPARNGRAAELIPQMGGKDRVGGKAAAYVCRGRSCSAPVTDPDALASLVAGPDPTAS